MHRLLLCLPVLLCACLETKGDTATTPTGTASGTAPTGDLVLSPGFETDQRSGDAAGEIEDTTCGAWFPSTPQLQMTLEANFLAMYVALDSPELALRIERDANNQWCGDITGQPNPTVANGAWSAETYDIYVGTVAEGGSRPFLLTVAEGSP